MNAHHTLQEKYALVQECRNSGLSDYQWCKRNHIPNSTFYSWVKQLQKKSYAVPDRDGYVPMAVPADKPEIVRLDIVEDNAEKLVPNEKNPIDNCAIELMLGGASVKISNNATPELIKSVMACLGGILC